MSGVLEELLARQHETNRLLGLLLERVGQDLVPLKEAASLARLSCETLRQLVQAGDLKRYGTPHKILISSTELREVLTYADRKDHSA